MDSREFATLLGRWQDDGTQELAFLIGGADGLSRQAQDAADVILSLGRMTWPHMLVRGLLAEHLLRAESILEGPPSHRDLPPKVVDPRTSKRPRPPSPPPSP